MYKRNSDAEHWDIQHYLTRNGHDPFLFWFDQIRDRRAKIQILRRLNRAQNGNLGDYRFCGEGVFELRVDVGAGYRVYFALDGVSMILLLCGGDKKTQQRDIDRAVEFWADWRGSAGS